MPGLPESFDMGKRLGLFVYFANSVRRKTSFPEIVERFARDYLTLAHELETFREGCSASAIAEARVGLPAASSRTSIDKVVRMTHGLGLIRYDYHSAKREIVPVENSFLVHSFLPEQPKSYFELNRPLKL